MRIERSMAAYWRNKGKLLCSTCLDRQEMPLKTPRAAESRFFRIPCQQQQKLTPAVGMMLRSFPPPIHGFPRRRRMRAPGLRHVCCTHHQAFQSLSVQNASKS